MLYKKKVNSDYYQMQHDHNNLIAFPSNWELSAARAASFVHLLMRKGIDPARMSATGYARFRPVAENTTKEGRQQNRRVVIIIPTVPDERATLEATHNKSTGI